MFECVQIFVYFLCFQIHIYNFVQKGFESLIDDLELRSFIVTHRNDRSLSKIS